YLQGALSVIVLAGIGAWAGARARFAHGKCAVPRVCRARGRTQAGCVSPRGTRTRAGARHALALSRGALAAARTQPDGALWRVCAPRAPPRQQVCACACACACAAGGDADSLPQLVLHQDEVVAALLSGLAG